MVQLDDPAQQDTYISAKIDFTGSVFHKIHASKPVDTRRLLPEIKADIWSRILQAYAQEYQIDTTRIKVTLAWYKFVTAAPNANPSNGQKFSIGNFFTIHDGCLYQIHHIITTPVESLVWVFFDTRELRQMEDKKIPYMPYDVYTADSENIIVPSRKLLLGRHYMVNLQTPGQCTWFHNPMVLQFI